MTAGRTNHTRFAAPHRSIEEYSKSIEDSFRKFYYGEFTLSLTGGDFRRVIAETSKVASFWWAERLNPDYRSKKEEFRIALNNLLCETLLGNIEVSDDCRIVRGDGDILTTYNLSVEYDPRDILLVALRQVGIQCNGYGDSAKGIFPQKHELTIRIKSEMEAVLIPKEGYRYWTEQIPVAVPEVG